jgi:hypothetical protein
MDAYRGIALFILLIRVWMAAMVEQRVERIESYFDIARSSSTIGIILDATEDVPDNQGVISEISKDIDAYPLQDLDWVNNILMVCPWIGSWDPSS